jgi:hypothetical protein
MTSDKRDEPPVQRADLKASPLTGGTVCNRSKGVLVPIRENGEALRDQAKYDRPAAELAHLRDCLKLERVLFDAQDLDALLKTHRQNSEPVVFLARLADNKA